MNTLCVKCNCEHTMLTLLQITEECILRRWWRVHFRLQDHTSPGIHFRNSEVDMEHAYLLTDTYRMDISSTGIYVHTCCSLMQAATLVQASVQSRNSLDTLKQHWAIQSTYFYKRLCPQLTCVSAFREIYQSLQCKIFQYTFFRQYPMKFWDSFSLCKIQEPAWLQLDHKKFKPSEVRCSGPYIKKLKKHALVLDIHVWKTLTSESIEFKTYQDGWKINTCI